MKALLATVLMAAVTPLFTVTDSRIDEASGIARGIRSPGVYYVQNDSGDGHRIFAIDRATGKTAATITVPNSDNVDWEDIAVARNAAGRASVWIADIGDNDTKRSRIQLYRIDEPAVAGSDRGRTLTSAAPDVWQLRYPDGAHNAEALFVRPDGTAYIVTKVLSGTSGVYRVPANPSASTQTLAKVGTVRFANTGRSNASAGIAASLLATGASMSADGSLLVIRTYTEAYVWTVTGGDISGALAKKPRRIELPGQDQGEGVAVDNGRLIVNSEGKKQRVFAVTIPAAARAGASSSPTEPAEQTVTAVAATPSKASARAASNTGEVWLGFGAGAAVVVGIAIVALRLLMPRDRAG